MPTRGLRREGGRVHRSVVVHPSGIRRGDDVDLRAKVCR